MFYGKQTKEMLAVTVAALFVMAFASSVLADMPAGYAAGSFDGTIIALDNAGKIVTVRSVAGEERMFALTENGQVMKCDKDVKWDTLKVGDEVKISYFEKSTGNYVAVSLTLSPGMEKCS